ncbi:MAG: hypothetical protein ABIO05_02735, partial [Ferruginibacter sp.]
MRLILFSFLSLIYFCAFSQDSPLATQCSRSKDVSILQSISYFQYSAMLKYDVKYLKLELSVEPGSKVIEGSATITAKAVAQMDSFVIELKNNLVVDSVYINGLKRNFTHSNDHIFVPLNPVIS